MTIQEVAQRFTELGAGDEAAFDAMAETVVAFQASRNAVYHRYSTSRAWDGWQHAAYLPVDAFKYAPVVSFPSEQAEHIFESSGTRYSTPSRHYVRSLEIYERAVATHFEAVFGRGPFTLVAHLPHYAERGERSSLLYMVNYLMQGYGGVHSGSFLDDVSVLEEAAECSRAGAPLLLFGAAFGLLDLVERTPVKLPDDALVIETGGMKTHRREMLRSELHRRVADGFDVSERRVWSEYGMCELMSQCYTRGDHIFFPPPWMRFRVVDPEDPSRAVPEGTPGALALFDLANLYSVAPLLTEDRAVQRGGGFEVLGRLSDAELRGCNFLLEST